MKHRLLFGSIVALALLASVASLTCPQPARASGAVEFYDDFESYPLGMNPTDAYEFFGIPWGGSPGPVPAADLYKVGQIGTNQVLQYHHDGPSVHFPTVGKLYRQEFAEIHEMGVTFYRTQHSMGWTEVRFDYQDAQHYYMISTSWTNRLNIYAIGGSTFNLGWVDLWADKHIMDVGHRIEVRRVGDELIASVIRLDTNETMSVQATATDFVGGQAGFSVREDWYGGVYANVDDFSIKGISVAASTPTPTPPGGTSCAVINARDLHGALVTGSASDSLQWFSWFQEYPWPGEAETYDQARNLYSYVKSDIYPEVSIEAGTPSNTYRLWIYQHDESLDRSLEVTVGGDAPVRTSFDAGAEGKQWKWLDAGVHSVGPDTIIAVRAIGVFGWHGQPFRQRRGGFRALYLTTDLGSGAPDFVPDGQAAGPCGGPAPSPPTADAGGPYTGSEGLALTLDGSGSTAAPGEEIVLYEWDLDGDGAYDDATGATAEVTFQDDGVSTVGLRVTDGDGESDTDAAEVAILNANPTVDAGPDAAILSGETAAVNALFADAGVLDTHTAVIDCGTGSGPAPASVGQGAGSGTVSGSCSYLVPAGYSVDVCVSDDDGGSGCDALTVSVKPYPVAIDVKPGSEANRINPKAKGRLPVAVLTTGGFDAGVVDPATVRLAGAAAAHWAAEDVDGDGDADLVLHFRMQELALDASNTEVVLSGILHDGVFIEGRDTTSLVSKDK